MCGISGSLTGVRVILKNSFAPQDFFYPFLWNPPGGCILISETLITNVMKLA